MLGGNKPYNQGVRPCPIGLSINGVQAAMTTKFDSELDAMVAAANAAIPEMDRCLEIAQATPPSIGPPPDLLGLIDQANRDMSPDSAAPPPGAHPSVAGRRRPNPHTAPGSRLKTAPDDLQELLEQAGHNAKPVTPATPPDVAWASAPGQSEANAPVTIDQAVDQTLRELVDKESSSPRHRYRSRWAAHPALMLITLAFLLIFALGFLAHRYWDGSLPLAEDQPTFAISTTQGRLAPLLIRARNSVEAYYRQHGALPDQIDLNVEGVGFFLSPQSQGYVIIAVSGGQNLAITREGRWFWAR